ncbi:type II secretion system F family protein [Gallaecimonas pentaromativorans]|uniref:Type IV pilus assembly protein PilC n=1 Tax=Gallaecimonas pentaromativorans TaxID=584787 RepID=A0A3N1PFN4_9GAMM|nr:type II secretion system F family protein [Gallaecimonas pentaromativorans]ROQ30754.1 type IV pilus assembly protein PilC [Gallaecimonas pentaromativorans]
MAIATATKRKVETQKLEIFSWKGLNRRGEKVQGEMTGARINEIKAQLRAQGITPKEVKRKPKSLFSFGQKVEAADIAAVTRQLATMLASGVPLVQSLDIIAKGYKKDAVREMMVKISGDVQGGTLLSEALAKYPTLFDSLYRDLVAAGEHSGAMETMFDRIATYKEKQEELKAKIKKALFYPSAIVFVAIVVTAILLIFVVPQFEDIFHSFGAELPAFTRLWISISHALQSSWYIIVGVLIIAGFSFRSAHRKSQSVRDKTDRFILRLPIVGSILHKAALARFARTLATTFAAGVPLIDGLASSAGASGNALYRDAVLKVRREVETGMQMNVAMRTTQVFPEMIIQMVLIGEESGSIDEMMSKVAQVYEREVDDAVDGLMSLLEPAIMIVLGPIIGGLVVAMYLPIFQLGQVVG